MVDSPAETMREEISVPNRTASLEKVRDFIIRNLEETELDERDQRLMVLAIDEAVTSNILFSVETGREGLCRVVLDVDETRIHVTIDDTGKDPDARDLTDQALRETAKKARKYEMSIFLIRQIVDEISYAFKKGFQNQLILIKFIPPRS